MVTYPEDWEVAPLGNKCIISSSKRVFEREWSKAGIPFLRTRDIASFHSGEEQKEKVYISEATYRDKITVSGRPNKGDLLVTGVGTIGLPYLIDNDEDLYFKDGNIIWIKGSERIYPRWLYLQFLSKELKRQVFFNSAFTTVGTFTISSAKTLIVPLPSLKEQKAIADALSQFDELIANLDELIEKKRNIREGIRSDLVRGASWLDNSKVEFTTLPLASIAQYIREAALCPKCLYVSTENMPQCFGGIEPYSGYDEVAGHSYKKGDVLLGNIRPYLKKAWLADHDGCCSPDVLVIRPNEDINPLILYYCLANDVFVDYVMSGGTKGTKMPRGDKKYIMQYQVAIPVNRNDQDEIAYSITSFDTEIAALEEERDKMIQIRDGAMDDLLTGRVRLDFEDGSHA